MKYLLIVHLLLALLVAPLPGVAKEKCKAQLAQDRIAGEYRAYGVKLGSVPKLTSNVLRQFAPFLIASVAPTYEDLLSPHHAKTIKSRDEDSLDHEAYIKTSSFRNVLSLFEYLDEDAEYYFVGNGYYIPYLMAKALFAQTPMSSRIKFIAFSRPLARIAANDAPQADTYFSALEIGKHKKRKIVIIDSVTTYEAPNSHSVIKTSTAIRRHLISKGWAVRDAIDSIITVGMPESSSMQTYRTTNLKTYFKLLEEITASNFEKAIFPYFDPKIEWSNPFLEAYMTDQLRWNGKYDVFDSSGFPRGEHDLRIQTEYPEHLQHRLAAQEQKAAAYLNIIGAGHKQRKRFSPKIKKIIESHNIQSKE